jgi:predicted ATPase with chaperone activity
MPPMQKPLETKLLSIPSLPAVLNDDSFWPFEPKSLEDCGVPESLVESIILQIFHNAGTLTGRALSDRIKLPFPIVEQQLSQLRMRQLVTHARPAALNDFYYSITEKGQQRALNCQKAMSYTGPLPVPLMDYVLSVEAQAGNFDPITEPQLRAALCNVTYDSSLLDFLGPAVNSNSGIFLYGPPGNGKSTVARCLAECRGQDIWIPHAIFDDGMIIKFYDQTYHTPTGMRSETDNLFAAQEYDHRWIRIRRPSVIVGGELTMDGLEIRHDVRSNTCEAPLQLKSNGGCLQIDDFGRQQIAPAELLNRWIVPLESRQDYLALPTGKKICVPFEQITIFSTNLEPDQLVDEAFMRRVPFKIYVGNPSVEEFVDLFKRVCESSEIPWSMDAVERLIDKHYRRANRSFRRCHARDLVHQIKCLCAYRGEPAELTNQNIDQAVRNYFGNSADSAKGNADSGTSASMVMREMSPEHEKTIVIGSQLLENPETRIKPAPSGQRSVISPSLSNADNSASRIPFTS